MEEKSLIERFFFDVREGEKIRISSGEGYWPIIETFEEKLWEISEKGELSIIIGPIVSVDDKHKKRDDGNPYLRLAKEGRATLFCPPCRQRFHYKIKGEREVLKENYHIAQASIKERDESLIDNSVIVNNYVRDHDLFLEEFGLKGITKNNWGNHFIYLKEEEIEKIKERLSNGSSFLELGLKYDFLTYNEIVNILKQLDIFKEEMIKP